MSNKAINLFNRIPNPDIVNMILLFNACARVGTQETLVLAKKVFSNLPHSYYLNSTFMTSAFDAFIKCGDLPSAEQLFSKMDRTIISYGNLMNAYNRTDQPEKTLDLYEQMKSAGIEPDLAIFLFLINASSHMGISSICQSIFEQIPNSFLDNIHVRNALIDMWVRISIS
jgi:pentatricopeptide repeat protein